MKLSWIFVILLLVAVAIFSVQNAEAISVHFLQWEISMSAALVIQLAAALGAIVGLLVGAYSGRRSRRAAQQPRVEPAPAPTPIAPPQPEDQQSSDSFDHR